MLLNFEDTMGYPWTRDDNIEKILDMIMAQQYSLKEDPRSFVNKG